MEDLKKNIEELESYYKANKSSLTKLKIQLLLLGVGASAFAYLRIISLKDKFNLTWLELNLSEGIVLLIILLPILSIPLFRFISDKIFNSLNWNMKASIFRNVLDKYNTEYKIYINRLLPDIDIKNLKLENGILTASYGDDLIFGTINNVNFRISEVHSSNLVKRKFDGIIGVLIYESKINETIIIQHSELLKDYLFKVIENKLYIIKGGNKNHFEVNFRKNKLNKEGLLTDYMLFNDFVKIMNEISLLNVIY